VYPQPLRPNKQEGAQTIIGFNFKASLTMDMEEVLPDKEKADMLGQRSIKFTLVDSAMFSDFSGEWRLQCYSRMPTGCAEGDDWTYSTKLFYMVNVKCVRPVMCWVWVGVLWCEHVCALCVCAVEPERLTGPHHPHTDPKQKSNHAPFPFCLAFPHHPRTPYSHHHQNHHQPGPRAPSPWARWSGASARTCPQTCGR
jgi:hypothetical protein